MLELRYILAKDIIEHKDFIAALSCKITYVLLYFTIVVFLYETGIFEFLYVYMGENKRYLYCLSTCIH